MRSETISLQTVVIGAGAVGLLYASRLILSGQSVTVVTRSKRQAEELCERSITFTQLDGQIVRIPVMARPIEHGMPEADVYLLTVKQTDLPDVLPALRELPLSARFVAMQNGMGHQELLEQVLPAEQCYFGIHTEGARRLSGTEVKHTGSGLVRVGPWDTQPNRDSLILAFVDAIVCAGINSVYVDSVKPFAWNKLMANALINPLTALFDIPNGGLLDNPYTIRLMRELFWEAAAVANACGQKMEEAQWQEIVTICRSTSQNLSSMLQDVKRHRRTEVEAINGYLVNKGKEVGISTPLHETLLHAILLKTGMAYGKEGGDST